jgi:caffeoyl-CoA O-methyltransferase
VNYYEAVLPRLYIGGVIVADNVLWSGRVLAPNKKTDRAVVKFNKHVRHDPRVECVMLPVRDGVSLIRKRG